MQEDKKYRISAELLKHKIKKMLEHCKIKQQNLDKLPQLFLQFLKERGLDKRQLTIPIPRYVRVKPHLKLSTQELAAKLGISADEIVQVQQYFWAINPQTKINRCEPYETGKLYGMDYSSTVPVKCLEISPKNRILQLCCAPGNKSMLMADLCPDVQITGVQININRANVMKNLVKKYGLDKQICVVTADGVKYQSEYKFDRVLVDAECTHQGSLKHIFKFFKQQLKPEADLKVNKKYTKQQQKQFKTNNSNPYTSDITSSNKWTKQDFEQRFLDSKKLEQLNMLQSGLLQNGFKLLKEGGIIVYSTCSFDEQQNQSMVRDFLKKHKNAELMNAGTGIDCAVQWKEGTLKGTLRLSPSVSCCGGMFVAKLRKEAQ